MCASVLELVEMLIKFYSINMSMLWWWWWCWCLHANVMDDGGDGGSGRVRIIMDYRICFYLIRTIA